MSRDASEQRERDKLLKAARLILNQRRSQNNGATMSSNSNGNANSSQVENTNVPPNSQRNRQRRSQRHRRQPSSMDGAEFFLTRACPFLVYLVLSYVGVCYVCFALCYFSEDSIEGDSGNKRDIRKLSQRTFILSRFWFQRCVGLISASAFISFWVDSVGLIGERGISPIRATLNEISSYSDRLTLSKYAYIPSVFWLFFDNESSSEESENTDHTPSLMRRMKNDWPIHLVCAAGVTTSLLVGVLPLIQPGMSVVPSPLLFLISAVLYSSIKSCSDSFMQLQWDAMLVEVNCICVFLELDSLMNLPFRYLNRSRSEWSTDSYASRIAVSLIYWLHFRLMFSAGFVKLSSGCPTWKQGTAMAYHYWTQPIPSPMSIFVHKMGNFAMSSYGSIFSEMVLCLPLFFVPFSIPRLISAVNTIGLMFVIFASGNYGFFNVLTATLAIPLFDDSLWPLFLRKLVLTSNEHNSAIKDSVSDTYDHYEFSGGILSYVSMALLSLWFVIILVASIRPLFHPSYTRPNLPDMCGIKWLVTRMSLWSIVNGYGLFARMTVFRHELIFQGTYDDPSLPQSQHITLWEKDNPHHSGDSASKKQTRASQTHLSGDLLLSDQMTNADINQDEKQGDTDRGETQALYGSEESSQPLTSSLNGGNPSKTCVWKTYEFKWKPGNVDARPPFALLHMPRLDWRLWFLPLRPYNYRRDEWFMGFVHGLKANNPSITGLLKYNPFHDSPNRPLRAVRVLKFEYRFPHDTRDDEYGARVTGGEQDWEIGQWWARRNLNQEYIPMVTD